MLGVVELAVAAFAGLEGAAAFFGVAALGVVAASPALTRALLLVRKREGLAAPNVKPAV